MHELMHLLQQWKLKYQMLQLMQIQYQSDIELFAQRQAQNPDDICNNMLGHIAEAFQLLQHPQPQNVVTNCWQAMQLAQNKLTNLDGSSTQTSIMNEFYADIEPDIKAWFNISALDQFGRLLENEHRENRNSLKVCNDKKLKWLKDLEQKLKQECPDKMASVDVYSSVIKEIDKVVDETHGYNGKINQELAEIRLALHEIEEGLPKPTNSIINKMLKRKLEIHLGEYVHGEAKVTMALSNLSSCMASMPACANQLNSNAANLDVHIQTLAEFVEAYNAFLHVHAEVKAKLESIESPEKFVSQIINDLVAKYLPLVGQHPKFNDIRHAIDIYKDAYIGTFEAIKHEHSELFERKKKNEVVINVSLPETRKDILERMKIKVREEACELERLYFSSGKYDLVAGECFEKLKMAYLNAGKSKRVIASLDKHAKGHPVKEKLIADFVSAVRQSRNLAEMVACHRIALRSPELMNCKTEIGRKLHFVSTTASYITELNASLDIFIDNEKNSHDIINSVHFSIEDEKKQYLAKNVAYSYDHLHQKLLAVLNRHTDLPEVSQLKEELMYISVWPGSCDGKRSRLVMALQCTKDLVRAKKIAHPFVTDVSNYMFDNQLWDKQSNSKNQQYQACPFSARYQELRNRLAAITSFRSSNKLWNQLDRLAAKDDDEVRKMQSMQQIVSAFYTEIRQSRFGSAGTLFGRGSRLGDALESFMTDKYGFYLPKNLVPHRILGESLLSKPFFSNFAVGVWPISCVFDAGSIPFFEMMVYWV